MLADDKIVNEREREKAGERQGRARYSEDSNLTDSNSDDSDLSDIDWEEKNQIVDQINEAIEIKS